MTNYVQVGDILDAVAPSGGVTSGDLVIINELVGVAGTTAAVGELFPLSTTGVFTLVKLAGTAINFGDKVYSDAGAGVDKTDTDTFVGFAAETVASGATALKVRLAH